MTGPALLREIGVALYGEYWIAEMARQRGVARKTVQRWANGDFLIPAGLWGELRDDLLARRTELARLWRNCCGR